MEMSADAGRNGCQEPPFADHEASARRPLPVSGPRVYALVRGGGLFVQKWERGGQNAPWEHVAELGGHIQSIAVEGEYLYCVTAGFEVHVQELEGANRMDWKFLSRSSVQNIATADGVLYGCGRVKRAAKPDGVYRWIQQSGPAGEPWERASRGQCRTLAAHGSLLYCLGTDGAVYRQPLAQLSRSSAWDRALEACPLLCFAVLDGGVVLGVRNGTHELVQRDLANPNATWQGQQAQGSLHGPVIALTAAGMSGDLAAPLLQGNSTLVARLPMPPLSKSEPVHNELGRLHNPHLQAGTQASIDHTPLMPASSATSATSSAGSSTVDPWTTCYEWSPGVSSKQAAGGTSKQPQDFIKLDHNLKEEGLLLPGEMAASSIETSAPVLSQTPQQADTAPPAPPLELLLGSDGPPPLELLLGSGGPAASRPPPGAPPALTKKSCETELDNPFWSEFEEQRAVMAPDETASVSHDHHDSATSKQLRKEAALGNVEAVTKMLDERADLHATDAIGRCAIHYASGAISVLKVLLERRADANSRDQSGGTPMDEADYWAVKQPRGDNGEQRKRSLACLELLQRHGGQRSTRKERSDGDFIDRRREQLERLAKQRGIDAPWNMHLAGGAGLAAASGTEPLPTVSGVCMHPPSGQQPLGDVLGTEIAVVQPQAEEDFHRSEASDDLTPPPTPLPRGAFKAAQEQWL